MNTGDEVEAVGYTSSLYEWRIPKSRFSVSTFLLIFAHKESTWFLLYDRIRFVAFPQ